MCRLSVEIEWLIAAHDRAPYSLEVLCGLSGIKGMLAEIETGRVNRGKWRILDGKEDEWSVVNLDLQSGSPCLC
jgi:hypothetical protein